MLVDCHCHLAFDQFDSDRELVVRRARDENILIVNSSVGPEEAEAALNLTKKYENVYWTLGLSASELEAQKVAETVNLIKKHRKEVIGLGEVGLDYYWVKDEKDQQTERHHFKEFIELSIELDLPLIVHSRDAEEDCITILRKYGKPALFHCFSGSLKQAEDAVSLGCLISIPTNVVYVKSRQRLARDLPLKSLVLETDAPYLSPTPKTRNEPVNVIKAAEKISTIKKITPEDVAQQTTENAKRFFRL